MKLAVLLLVLTWLVFDAHSAEISIQSYDAQDENVRGSEDYNFGRPFILLEGEIVPGDYDRLQQEAHNLIDMNVPLVLLLNSPGGSVSEALHIADFVRANWTTTWIKGKSIGVDDTDRAIATCDSACAIIFFAGIERRYSGSNMLDADDPHFIPIENRFDWSSLPGWLGEPYEGRPKTEIVHVLGLHRPYFRAAFNKQLPGETAQQLYSEMEKSVNEKLTRYGVPITLIDRMMRTSSSNIDRISNYDLFQIIPTIEPWFEEWRIATCGALTSEEEHVLSLTALQRTQAKIGMAISGDQYPDSTVNFLERRQEEISECKVAALLQRQAETVQNE